MTMCSTHSGSQDLNPAVSGWWLLHDSRDVQDKPSKGWLLNFNNVAYREGIAGDNDFDVYRLDYRGFWSHGDGNVIAVRQSNQWTVDAPPSAYAPVLLRGYTMGEYLGKNMSSLEVEERYKFAERWTATFFAGGPASTATERNASPTTSIRATVQAFSTCSSRNRGSWPISNTPRQGRQQCRDLQNGLCVVTGGRAR